MENGCINSSGYKHLLYFIARRLLQDNIDQRAAFLKPWEKVRQHTGSLRTGKPQLHHASLSMSDILYLLFHLLFLMQRSVHKLQKTLSLRRQCYSRRRPDKSRDSQLPLHLLHALAQRRLRDKQYGCCLCNAFFFGYQADIMHVL